MVGAYNVKTKVLFMSDGVHTPSGFGTVMKNLTEKLKDDFEIGIHSWQHLGRSYNYDGIKVLSNKRHIFGKDSLVDSFNEFNPDVLITLGDFWMLTYLLNEDYQKILKEKNIKWIWYLPVDCNYVPRHFIEIAKSPDLIISMAKHGEKALNDVGINNVYIPHGVDLDVFVPAPKEVKEELRRKNNLGGYFVIGTVSRNQDRKQFPRLVKAFANFAKDKDDVKLFFHCDPYDPANMAKGFNNDAYPILINSIQHYDVTKKVVFTGNFKSFTCGVSLKELCSIYNIFDIHAMSTSGEGFGLPIIESIACGIPNVMTNYTTAQELVEGRGEVVKVKDYIFGTYGTQRAIIDTNDMADKFQMLYDDWKNGSKLLNDYSNKCIEKAKEYSWDVVVEKWKEVINNAVAK